MAALLPVFGARAATPIQHVIMIMQENRAFDNYFGTFPGANGIPQGTCVPLDPAHPKQGCVVPFHDQHDVNAGGPHGAANARADLDDGINTTKLDGFVNQQTVFTLKSCNGNDQPALKPTNCKAFVPGAERHDVMGYHTADELPNYWAYAQHFVLQDSLFEGVRGYSLGSHLDLVSEWAAACSNPAVITTCKSNPDGGKSSKGVRYPWTNLFEMMDINGVSWKYYLGEGTEPDCDDGEMTCAPQIQANGVLSLWNPPPGFSWVASQGQSYLQQHNPSLDRLLVDIKGGTLAQVSWVVPAAPYSEHPATGVTAGMEYVTSIVNAVMQSPYWANTAIFIAWDDWGGFYDHVIPPNVDRNNGPTPIQGFGLRVPGMLVSAYAKAGSIDHSVLSFDSYAVLIEDLFMNGSRLDPAQYPPQDSRPTIRDELTSVTFPDGNTAPIGLLINEFDFGQKPLPPLVLSTHIPTEIFIDCGSTDPNNPQTCVAGPVKIYWHAVNGAEVPGPFTYQVLRDGQAINTCRSTKTVCVDTQAGSGVHYYRVYSIDSDNVSSPPSAAAEADEP
jgi:phospholipase C